MNILTPDDIDWTSRSHMSFTKYFHSLQRCDKFGIQREVITNRTSDGAPTKSTKEYFFIDGQPKEYTNLQELCDDWNKIKKYDEVGMVLTFVEVVKPKVK